MIESIRLPLLGALTAFCMLAGSASAKETQGLRYPSLTPDGKSVVFCYRGDVWISPLDASKSPQRLTIHEDQDTLSRVSPDGKQIAFSSKRHGGYDLYVMPITGGEPKQVTHHSTVEILCEWSPDGKKLLFISNRDAGVGRLDLYEVNVDGNGTPRRLTWDGARDGSYSPDGKSITYVRGFNSIYWDNYKGSANYDIYVLSVDGGKPQRLTKTDGNERYPFYSADSKSIYFVAEEKGVANFYSMPTAGGERKQLTKNKRLDVHRPDMANDHKRVVFELAGKLYWCDLSQSDPKPTPLKLSVQSDVRNSGLEFRTITSGGEQVHLSADGRQAAFVLRGDVWIMAASGGNARRVTQGPTNDQWPRWSPDGKSIAYFTNPRGNADIVVLDVGTGRTRPVTTSPNSEFFHNWSPDGKTIVFCREAGGNKDIWTVDVATRTEKRLTTHPGADDDPSFSPDGKKIVFDSARGGAQAIYTMNVNGSGKRAVVQGPISYQVPSYSPDGKFLVFEAFSPATGGNGLFVASANGGPSMQVSRDGSTACWSPRGDYIYFSATRGRTSGIYRIPAPTSLLFGERVPFIGRVTVDRRKELAQLFDEAHTALRTGFYDAKMHGVNWAALKKKYRPMAVDADNKDEFHNIVRQMLAELGASHLGINGGQRDLGATPNRSQTGHLGLEFEQEPMKDGARRIAKIIANSTADKSGLRVGDVVTMVKGRTLQATTNLDQLLDGTVGKNVSIVYKPLTADGLGTTKNTSIRALSWGQVASLGYSNWVATCAHRVKQGSEGIRGEIGYIHLNAMNPQNLARFQQAVQRWNQNKRVKAMILDVRNNGGGNIHQQLMQILVNRPLATVQMRGGPKVVQPGLYWDKPVVVLCNERSFSDAEVFPYMFQAAKCGPVIGVPTAGGVIGTRDMTLSDGSSFRVPRVGFWGMDGTNLEGLGVKPDIIVEETTEDRLTGKDPQLAKAIEVVAADVKARRKAAKAKTQKKPDPVKPKVDPTPAPVKPDVTPAPKPVPSPASANTPLADTRVGEWVRYRVRLPGATEDGKLLIRVIRVTGEVVELEKIVESGNASLPLPTKVQRNKVLDAIGAYGKLLSHSIVQNADIKGEKSELLTANLEMPDGSRGEMFFSNHVPALGLWKFSMRNHVILEAIEWGAPAPTEKTVPAKADPKPEPKPEPEAEPDVAPVKKLPPHPMADAKTGEWTRVRHTRGGIEFEVTRRVTDTSDDEITMSMTLIRDGVESPARSRTRKRPTELKPRGEAEVEYSNETLTVNEVELKCVVMTIDNNGITEKVWVCMDIPVDGLVKHERGGTVVAELLAWGNESDG